MFDTTKQLDQQQSAIARALYWNPALNFLRSRTGFLLSHLFPRNACWVRIRGGVLRGLEIYAELRHGEKSYWLGTFELGLQSAIQQLAKELPNTGCIYDVGAHVGFFSMMFARCFERAHIFAFEPHPFNQNRLTLNIRRNGLTPRVTPLVQAVSDESQRTHFHIGKSTWSGSLLHDHRSDYLDYYEVWTTTLDKLIFEDGYPAPELIKIDVEGAETRVLGGAINVLRRCKPTLIIELHHRHAGEWVVCLLRQLGYRIWDLNRCVELVGAFPSSEHVLARHNS